MADCDLKFLKMFSSGVGFCKHCISDTTGCFLQKLSNKTCSSGLQGS